MGLFKSETAEEKIAKIRKLREEAEVVRQKYNAVQKKKKLDSIYAKEKAEVEKRKYESSRFGQFAEKAKAIGAKVANSSVLKASPQPKGKPRPQRDFVFGNMASPKQSSYDPIFGNLNQKKKKEKKYDPIFG